MKLQTGDLLLTQIGTPILIIDADKKSGLVKGIFAKETEIKNIGYEHYIIESITYGRWRHFPVVK